MDEDKVDFVVVETAYGPWVRIGRLTDGKYACCVCFEWFTPTWIDVCPQCCIDEGLVNEEA